jgi:hypothetical protein
VCAVKYPAMILNEDGWGVVLEGHGLESDALRAVCVDWFGGTEFRVAEVHFEYVPRIKNCSERDGWGCDNEGEWHAHWFEVRPAADGSTAFTVLHEVETPEVCLPPGGPSA